MNREHKVIERSIGLFVLICLFLTGCSAQKALTQKRIKTVEKGLMRAVYLKGLKPEKLKLAERMQFYKVPGVSIAAIDKNKLEWARAYGEKDILTRQPLTTDTLFQGGAFSQIMTAAAAVRLAERGKLDLDGNIRAKLNSWKLPTLLPGYDSGGGEIITPKALLTHSAGLSDQVFAGYAQDEPLPSMTQILNGVKPANNRPVWVPGWRSSATRTVYSEPGYVVLEQLLMDQVEKPFSAFMKETVLDPLALKSSTFELPLPDDLRFRAASGHLHEGQPVIGLWNNYPEAAAKGLWTTPSDFATFLVDLLQAATGNIGKILSPETARYMLSRQVESYGFGFLVEGTGDDINFTLRGKTHGFACFMTVYPAKAQGAVIMTNSDNGFMLIQEILCALTEAYGWPHGRPEEKPTLRLDPATYQQYVGRYEVNPDYILDVTVEDYYLVIRPTGQAPTRFYAEGQTLFYSTDPYVRIQFMRKKMGVFDSLILWQQDFELEAKRIQ